MHVLYDKVIRWKVNNILRCVRHPIWDNTKNLQIVCVFEPVWVCDIYRLSTLDDWSLSSLVVWVNKHPANGNDWLADGFSEDMLSFSSKSIDLLNDEGFPGTEDTDEFGPTECSLQEGGAVFGVVWLLCDNELSPLDLDLTAGGGRPITEKMVTVRIRSGFCFNTNYNFLCLH